MANVRGKGWRLALVALVIMLLPGGALAGSGRVGLTGHYYLDDNTRVVQPVADVSYTTDSGTQLNASGLVDVISSASIAQGARGDVVFTEARWQGGMGIYQAFGDVGAGLSYSYSTETDYDAHLVILNGDVSLNEDNTQLSLALSRGVNTVGHNQFGDLGHLEVGGAAFALTQVLSRRAIIQLSAEASRLSGMQENPYRSVLVRNQLPARENVPNYRNRLTLCATGRYELLDGQVLDLATHFYTDNWGINSGGFEPRLHLTLGPWIYLRPGYGYYQQGAADFFRTIYDADDGSVTADPKHSAFTNHSFNMLFSMELGLFEEVPFFEWFAEGRGEIYGEYLIQGNIFGDAIIVSAGYSHPF